MNLKLRVLVVQTDLAFGMRILSEIVLRKLFRIA